MISAPVDLSPDPLAREWLREEERLRGASPLFHVREGLPPTLVLHATNDRNCPFGLARAFVEKMRAHGNRCELEPFAGRGHFFTLVSSEDNAGARRRISAFLTSTGMLP